MNEKKLTSVEIDQKKKTMLYVYLYRHGKTFRQFVEDCIDEKLSEEIKNSVLKGNKK